MKEPCTWDYDKSSISHKRHQGEGGSGLEYFVRLPDGYLISCGNCPERAVAVARCISNAEIPEHQWGQYA